MLRLNGLSSNATTGTAGLDGGSNGVREYGRYENPRITSTAVVKTHREEADEHLSSVGRAATQRYRSAAVRVEVKLKEALKHTGRPSPSISGSPDALRVAVCLRMLNELSQLSGPFQPSLDLIHEELGSAVFSDYYEAAGRTAATGGNERSGTIERSNGTRQESSLVVQQQPYFHVVHKLEQQLQQMEQARQQWESELSSWRDAVASVDQELSVLRQRVHERDQLAEQLQHDLRNEQEKLARAQKEAFESNDELRRARREASRGREENQRARSFAEVQPHENDEAERLRRQCVALQQELSEVRNNVNQLQEERKHLISKSDYDAAEKEARQLRLQLSTSCLIWKNPKPA